jgi:hypothetical protein
MVVSEGAFIDFVLFKAFDVISGSGSYRKFVHQSTDSGEDWAIRMTKSVSDMNVLLRELHNLVERVRRLPNSKVATVCSEVVLATRAPIRVLPGWSTCFLTDNHAFECIDVARVAKNGQVIPLHPRFAYFVLQLFYCHRLEHVVRTYTKNWLDCEAQAGVADIHELTARFQEQVVLFRAMHAKFCEGFAHVKQSLDKYMNSK